MKKNKLIGASLALALGTGLLTSPAYANAELESDLQKASELTESMKNHKVEVDKIRRGKSEEKPDDDKKPSTPSKDDKDHGDDLTGEALESKDDDGKEEAETDSENTTDNTKDNKINNSKNEGSTNKNKVDTSENKVNKEQVSSNSSNVKTGITPLTGVVATLIASVGAFSYSKKENK